MWRQLRYWGAVPSEDDRSVGGGGCGGGGGGGGGRPFVDDASFARTRL